MATDLVPASAAALSDTDGGIVLLRPDTDLDELFSLIDVDLHWRCAVSGDRLIWMPPANGWSSSLGTELLIELVNRIRALPGTRVRSFGADAGFKIADTPGPHGRIVSPDFALVAEVRITTEVAPRRGFWPLRPDLAVEVRSPSDRPQVWHEKLDMYAEVPDLTLWAIDPEARTVHVFRHGNAETERPLRDEGALLHVPDSLTMGVSLSITLGEIWRLTER